MTVRLAGYGSVNLMTFDRQSNARRTLVEFKSNVLPAVHSHRSARRFKEVIYRKQIARQHSSRKNAGPWQETWSIDYKNFFLSSSCSPCKIWLEFVMTHAWVYVGDLTVFLGVGWGCLGVDPCKAV